MMESGITFPKDPDTQELFTRQTMDTLQPIKIQWFNEACMWIAPNGDTYPVAYGRHFDFAWLYVRAHTDLFDGISSDVEHALELAGWVKVSGTSHKYICCHEPMKVTGEQLRVLERYKRQTEDKDFHDSLEVLYLKRRLSSGASTPKETPV